MRARFVAHEGSRSGEGDADGIVCFYLAPAGDPLLVHRPESHHDGAIPSGASLAVHGLLRLGLVAGDTEALALAEKYLVQRLGGTLTPNAWATSSLLAALDVYLDSKVLVVTDSTDGANRDALLSAARRTYAPTLSIAGPWAAPSVLEGKTPDGANARAYVCTGPTCSPPVTEVGALVELLTK